MISVLGKQISAVQSGQLNEEDTDDYNLIATTQTSHHKDKFIFSSSGEDHTKARQGDIISTYGNSSLKNTPLMLKWRLSATIAPLSKSTPSHTSHHASVLRDNQLLDTLSQVKSLFESSAAPLSHLQTKIQLEKHSPKKKGKESKVEYFHHLLSQTSNSNDMQTSNNNIQSPYRSTTIHGGHREELMSPMTIQSEASLTPKKTLVQSGRKSHTPLKQSEGGRSKQVEVVEVDTSHSLQHNHSHKSQPHMLGRRPPEVAVKSLKEGSVGVLKQFQLKKYVNMMYQLSQLNELFENKLLKEEEHGVSSYGGANVLNTTSTHVKSMPSVFHKREFENSLMKIRSVAHKTSGASFLRDIHRVQTQFKTCILQTHI